MAEWTIATVCKTVALTGYPGSNPGPDTYESISFRTVFYSDRNSRRICRVEIFLFTAGRIANRRNYQNRDAAEVDSVPK